MSGGNNNIVHSYLIRDFNGTKEKGDNGIYSGNYPETTKYYFYLYRNNYIICLFMYFYKYTALVIANVFYIRTK